jgi:hypothetical protein
MCRLHQESLITVLCRTDEGFKCRSNFPAPGHTNIYAAEDISDAKNHRGGVEHPLRNLEGL